MHRSFDEALDALFQLEFFGMKLGLENIQRLLAHVGNPERTFRSIHIAGTNGKGSVAAMLAAVHQSAGRKTGLFTSPHLIDFRERIKLNGEMISREAVSEFLGIVWPLVEELRATFFEVTTAMAFWYFARVQVDVAIIETGLGGRLDSTNVLEHPLAAVITSIGYDHMAQLGNTLELIAGEKAGIIKSGSPAIVSCYDELLPVFAAKAAEVGSPLLFVPEWAVPASWASLKPSLLGEHQRDNLKTVLACLSVLPYRLPDRAIEEGIRNTASLTRLRGRLEEFEDSEARQRGVRLLLDVGHNEAAMRRLREYFEQEQIRPVVVLGLMRDKDIAAALRELRQFAREVVAVQASTSRALPAAELAEQAREQGIEATTARDVAAGVAFAVSRAPSGDVVLLAGSHYVVGEFLKNYKDTSRVIPDAAQIA